MPKLFFLNGERQGASVDVLRTLALGSSRNSDVHFRDAAVSWNHARVVLEGGDLFVEDLSSANGTLLNGSPVQRSRLNPGNVIEIGGTQLKLQGENGAALPSRAPETTPPQRPVDGAGEIAEARKALSESEEERQRAVSALEEANKRAAAAEKKAAHFEKRAKESAAEASRLSKELKGLEGKEAVLSRDAAAAHSSTRELERETARLQREIDAAQKDLASARGDGNRIQKEREKTERDHEKDASRARENAARLEAALRDAAAGKEKAEEAAEREKCAHSETTRALESLRAQVESARAAEDASQAIVRSELESVRRREEIVRGQVDSARSDIDALRGELDKALRAVDAGRLEIEATRIRENRYQTELARAGEDALSFEKLEAEKAELLREIESMKLRAEGASASLERERELRAADRSEIAILRSELARSTESSAEISDRLRGDLLALEREKAAGRAECEGLRRDVEDLAALRAGLSAAREENDASHGRIRDLETARAVLEASVRAAEANEKRTAAKLDAAEEKARERFGTLEARVLGLLAERDGERAELHEKLRAVESRAVELEGILERERLQSRVREDAHKAVQASLLDEGQKEREALLERLETAGREKMAICDDRSAIEGSLETLRGEIEAARRETAAARAELASQSVELGRAASELAAERDCLERERGEVLRKNGDLDRLRLAFADLEREHRAELHEVRVREEAREERAAALSADVDGLKALRERDLAEVESLRARESQAETEITMLRGYAEELKEKIREKDRVLLERRTEAREGASKEVTRLLREKRKLEAFVRDLTSTRAGAVE